ncbi:MAG: hypothetical protein AAGN46_17810 [Acidobacteriota bacterium]
MKCRRVRDEFILIFGQEDAGRRLLVAIRHHADTCPDCQETARQTQHFVTILRQRCSRWQAPSSLRNRIVEHLRSSTSA